MIDFLFLIVTILAPSALVLWSEMRHEQAEWERWRRHDAREQAKLDARWAELEMLAIEAKWDLYAAEEGS